MKMSKQVMSYDGELARLISKKKITTPLEIKRVVNKFPYTFVELKIPGGKVYGFSKCSPKDKYDPWVGFSIAASRALSEV